ncbi:Zn-dependent hydrolase [Acidihalobacter ferrooxydans]|uniref:Zn-dependent hydrolase n=1 Tax=Acidihalobacter ferrooxydans TaxID=1765967 RepID=A0A1P8ULH8_9GAMM|nr:Zn-dependent hydrolase [Acidihalobacter ferrooxydans]
MFRQLFDDDSSTYTYLLADALTREGVVIDPVKEQHERDLSVIRELGINLKYTIDTHVHADHVTGSGPLREVLGAKVVTGAATGLDCSDVLIPDGQPLTFGNEVLTAIATPGHTDGCTSYRWRDRLFTGDTLLINACGRTDFQQGDAGRLYDSIQRLFAHPDETLVFPGHDYEGRRVSSIGQEKALNPRLAGKDRQAFIDIMNGLDLPYPRHIDRALPANQTCGLAV